MAANVAALLRLLRMPGAGAAAAAAEAAAQERHGAVLRLMRAWTQDVINTLRPTLLCPTMHLSRLFCFFSFAYLLLLFFPIFLPLSLYCRH
jgi:hypothetical protein